MSELPSSKRRKRGEDEPILNEDDFKKSIHNIADLPDYLERINQNILNIDKQISKKEINTDKVKELVKKNNKKNESLSDIKQMVKQSVEGINDIFKSHKVPLAEPEPMPQALPFQQQHYISHPYYEHSHITSNKNIQSTILKPAEKEQLPSKKNSKKGINPKEIPDIKKSLKIDITKYNTNVVAKADRDKKIHLKDNKGHFALDNNKKLSSNDSTPNKCIVQVIQKSHQSKSPVPKKNGFLFKSKNRREPPNDISEEGETHLSAVNVMTIDDRKKLPPSGAKVQVYTTQNTTIKKTKTDSLIDNSNKAKATTQQQPMSNTLPKQQAKTPNYYSKEMPKGATAHDILKLMLFFNEYIISQKAIKDFKKHKGTLHQYSHLLSELLNENTVKESIDIPQKDFKSKDSKQTAKAIRIQRQWRLRKFKQSIPPQAKEVDIIKAMIVDNFIDKEGFSTRKLIGIFNESMESFLQLKKKDQFIHEMINLNLNKVPKDTLASYHKEYNNACIVRSPQGESTHN